MEAVEAIAHDNRNNIMREPASAVHEECLTQAIRNYRPKLYGIAFRKLRNAQDAEDALQDALLSAFKNLSQFKGEAQMTTWLTAIVMNSARMMIRRQYSRNILSLHQIDQEGMMSAEDCFVDGAPGPEERYRRAEFRQKLQDASESLSATIRGAFRLVVLKGFSTREAARELGVSKGTIKARLFQARRQMIAMLGGATGPKDAKSPRVRTRPRHVNARAVVLQTEAASARL